MNSLAKQVVSSLLFVVCACFFAPAAHAWIHPNSGLPPARPPLDLTTPQRALAEFMTASREGDYDRAAHALDLRSLPNEQHAEEGPRLARQLWYLLDRKLFAEADALSDEVDGNPLDGPREDRVGEVSRGPRQEPAPIGLIRLATGPQERGWYFTRETVDALDSLYELHGPALIEQHLPGAFVQRQFLQIKSWQWIGMALALIVAWIGARILRKLVGRIFREAAARTHTTVDDALANTMPVPMQFLTMALFFWGILQLLHLAATPYAFIKKGWQIVFVIAVTRAFFGLIDFAVDRIDRRAASADGSSQFHLRSVKTQATVLRRIAQIVGGFVATALILMQFETVRNIGVSLLASAGVAGIVLGLAAQKSIGALLSGIQLSLTQPIRIGDQVIVEKEFGTVEEIMLTYIVISLWDERRLVVPVSYFLEKPFLNLTRTSSQQLGTVEIYADYHVPVDVMRKEFERIIQNTPLWDKRTGKLHVTKVSDTTVELRALVSARDPDALFDLRCVVREKLVAYLQELSDGRYLPRRRVEGEPVLA